MAQGDQGIDRALWCLRSGAPATFLLLPGFKDNSELSNAPMKENAVITVNYPQRILGAFAAVAIVLIQVALFAHSATPHLS
jgi:hypothetical protein